MRSAHITSLVALILALTNAPHTQAQQENPFDGRPWNISTGNLSVLFTQASPVGAFPKPDFIEPPSAHDDLVRLKNLGLVAYEDYITWGAIEREPGKWDWRQHDAMEKALHAAGLKYVVYNWPYFPPVWLREQPEKRTLMKCMEHGQETNYLSIFDPRTIEYYDHFYREVYAHFGDRVDDIYACILGPYGEGNYPQLIPDWINMGHCHEGYWCADEFAIRSLQQAMQKKYGDIAALNQAWGTQHKSFDDVRPPAELSQADFKPVPEVFQTATDKRRWLDFITWYHQAIIDFAEQSLKTVLKYYPPEKVRIKPGGSAGGVNPISWGTYCPGYAKMAKGYGIVMQPADCQGAVFADKWMGTAYQFYGVKECTEPATALDASAFAQRIFNDANAGAAQLFTYEFEQHAADIQKYIHLFTGKPGETEIAVYCPTTLYRLGGNLKLTIDSSYHLRDLCNFDVLDELLITDGALSTDRYKTLVMFQADIVDQPVLDAIERFQKSGGRIVALGQFPINNVEGKPWPGAANITRIDRSNNPSDGIPKLADHIADCKGYDGQLDGVWQARRGPEAFAFNTSTDKPATVKLNNQQTTILPRTIESNPK